ncbi:MAG: P-loop NTPase [Clostridiales bacterium]|jgi:flagellar biosynthesis protein FlhG|nr:P-loop NTPase [Clostridiales bacterium]
MTDQAEKLRSLVQNRTKDQPEPVDILEARKQQLIQPSLSRPKLSARVIAITSGKGGVGKTNVAINIAIHMRRQGKRVVMLDTDFGLANIEVLFGVNPKYNFGDVLSGLVSIEAAMSTGPMGVQFLSGGSGLTALSNITEEQMAVLVDSFSFLNEMADIILIDTGAGVSKSVVNFVKAAQEAIVVTTPDPTSVTDAYALIKTVKDTCLQEELPEFKLIVNRVDSPSEGVDVYEKLGGVCGRFLGIRLSSLGNIPHDPHLTKAVKKQQPVSLMFPNTDSARCLEAIANKLLDMKPVGKKAGLRSFVLKLVGRLGN